MCGSQRRAQKWFLDSLALYSIAEASGKPLGLQSLWDPKGQKPFIA